MKFLNKRTNEIKEAYSIEIKNDKVHVKFNANGKEYTYNKKNIEILNEEIKKEEDFIIYKLTKKCYKCQKTTTIYTYIIFDDKTKQDVVFPWDKERLLKNQHTLAHLQDPSIEYYGLKVVGEDKKRDNILMKKFPDKIQVKYSKTMGASYPMNLCDHCGSIQGWNFVYRKVNQMIKKMKEIEILK